MNKKAILGLWIVVFVLIGTLLSFYIKWIVTNSTKLTIAHKGIFSFDATDFEKHNILKLHGEVEFYWDTLLGPNDFSKNNSSLQSGLIRIPGKWNQFKSGSKEIKGQGYGTYRFKIIVPKDELYALKLKDFKSAYKIFINDEHLGGAGKVARNKIEMKPSRLRREYYFLSKNKEIDVIIQVSNFHHRKGGAIDTIIFGQSKEIIEYKNVQIGVELFIFGILFILFIYHFALYAYRNKDKSALYFSLLCLSMLLRLGYTGEKIILEIAPFLSWAFAIRLEYISFMAIPIFTVAYFRTFFPIEISKRVFKIISYACGIFIATILFTSTTFFSYTPIIANFFLGVTAFYVLVLIFIAMLRGREYSGSVFFGFVFFYLLSLNDLLYYTNTIESAYLMPLGLGVVAISQVYVLARKNSSAYAHSEKLSAELIKYSNELEEIVEKRTIKIRKNKEKIEKQKRNIERKAIQLKTKNEELISLARFKRDMTSMMIHDLKNPLSNIIGFAQLPGQLDEFRDLIYSSGWGMQNLIQNILDVEKYESTKLKLNLNKFSLYELVEEAYKDTLYMVLRNEINFENHIPKDLIVSVDKSFIIRVFANIFSNAIKYSYENGIIRVSGEIVSENGKDFCKVDIYNSGEPIPAEEIGSIFDKFVQIDSAEHKFTYSTGIGLTFCQLAVEAHKGEIGVTSGKESGVTFWFTLPL